MDPDPEAHPAYVALQDHADVVETELAGVKAELAEANAVIARVRKVREAVSSKRRLHYDRWNETDNEEDGAKAAAYQDVLDRLDAVEGL
jgi:hypothetical protein